MQQRYLELALDVFDAVAQEGNIQTINGEACHVLIVEGPGRAKREKSTQSKNNNERRERFKWYENWIGATVYVEFEAKHIFLTAPNPLETHLLIITSNEKYNREIYKLGTHGLFLSYALHASYVRMRREIRTSRELGITATPWILVDVFSNLGESVRELVNRKNGRACKRKESKRTKIGVRFSIHYRMDKSNRIKLSI